MNENKIAYRETPVESLSLEPQNILNYLFELGQLQTMKCKHWTNKSR